MYIWVRDSKSRLGKVKSTMLVMAEENANQSQALQDRCYPARSAQPSCIRLPAAHENNFELKAHFINMLPRFTGLDSEDAYLFISEFEEVCVMMKIQNCPKMR